MSPHALASTPSSVCCAGYTGCFHTQATSQTVTDSDLELLFCSEQPPQPVTGLPTT